MAPYRMARKMAPKKNAKFCNGVRVLYKALLVLLALLRELRASFYFIFESTDTFYFWAELITLEEMFTKADKNKDGKFSNAEVDQLSHINEHKLGVIRDLALAINIPHIW